jgi:hypothetical protein
MKLKDFRKFLSPSILLLVFFASFSIFLSAANAEVPRIKSVSYTTYIGEMYVTWDIDFSGAAIDVDCEINGDPVKSCAYSGNPGLGGCTIRAADLYDFTPDAGGETRTVGNTLGCTACDVAIPTDCDNKVETFYPFDFDVTAPPRISAVVGGKYNIIITVKNNGTLTDAYTMNIVSSNSQVFSIENGAQATQMINQNTHEQMYVDSLMVSSEEVVDVTLTVTSNTSRDYVPSYGAITHTQIIPVLGSDKSLPDFGLLGLLQIMLVAAVLVSFLF